MPAHALEPGDAENGKADHAELDDVDIAEDRRVEEAAQDDLDHAQDHQAEDQRPADQRADEFKRRQQPVGPPDRAAEQIVRRP